MTIPMEFKSTQRYSSSLFDVNNDDRKSLDLLVNKLFASVPTKSEQFQTLSSKNSKLIQLSISKFCSKSSETSTNTVTGKPTKMLTRARSKSASTKNHTSRNTDIKQTKKKVCNGKVDKRTKNNMNSTKLTSMNGWLSKNPTSVSESLEKNIKNKLRDNKQVSSENLKGKKALVEHNTKIFKRHSSGSFEKYGMFTPSVEDAVAYRKKYESDKQFIDNLDTTEDSQNSLNLSVNEPEAPEIILDCKHLTSEQISEAFESNYQYVYDIFHGIQHSIRHERFKKKDRIKDQFTTKDLNYNTSMLAFTYEQKKKLLSRLHKKFDQQTDLCNNSQYFFKVLLPELCMKIFMDVHKMSYDEAAVYLEECPV